MKQGLLCLIILMLFNGDLTGKKQASPIDIIINKTNGNGYEVLISAKHCELLRIKLFNFTTEAILREEIHNCESLPIRKIYKNETSDRLGLIVEAELYGKLFKKNAMLEYRRLNKQEQQAEFPRFIELPAAD